MFSSVRWSYKPSFKKFLGANFELNDLIVNFVPFLPIFGISLRLKREVQKFSYSYFTVVFSSVRWSYKPSFKKFLGANFELNDLIVNFVPFLPIFGISLRLKREVQKFSYSYFTVVFSSVRWSYKPSFKKFLGANFELNDFVPLLYHSVPLFEKWYKWYKKVRLQGGCHRFSLCFLCLITWLEEYPWRRKNSNVDNILQTISLLVEVKTGYLHASQLNCR